MNKLGLNKTASKRKCDRFMDRINNSFNNHKNIKNKKPKNKKDLFIETFQ